MKNRFVFVPVDKAASNIAIICKAEYTRVLRHELERKNGAYQQVDDGVTEQKILDDHTDVLGRFFMGSMRLPYLYAMPKFHKSGNRFIAGSGDCSTVVISKLLSDVLLNIMRSLREKDDQLIRTTSIRRYFVVERFEEVSQFLGRWRRTGETRSIQSGDFATMYTTIPHPMLFEAIEKVTREAFKYESEERGVSFDQLRIEWTKVNGHVTTRWTRGGGSGRAGKQKQRHTFSCDDINKWVKFLVSNTYIVNGGVVRQQILGVPIGTNCAPSLANLFLYAYESGYIDRLIAQATAQSLLKAAMFHITFRYIDDVLSIDNPLWKDAVREIYPDALTLADTSPSDEKDPVHFLGMDIVGTDDNRFRLWVYDKRDDFQFVVRRYPRMESLIPQTIPYGVFLGQLHRGYRICTLESDFRTFAVGVACRLIDNGCGRRRLGILFGNFVQRVVKKYRSKHDLCNGFRRELGNSE